MLQVFIQSLLHSHTYLILPTLLQNSKTSYPILLPVDDLAIPFHWKKKSKQSEEKSHMISLPVYLLL